MNTTDSTYPALLLRDNKLKLLDNFTGAKKHHRMKCMICSYVWTATPISKRQAFKKHGVVGCPECSSKRIYDNKILKQEEAISKLKDRGITILSKFTTLHSTTTKLTFYNIRCGHTFTTQPGNVINRGVDCPICGIQKRVDELATIAKIKSYQWQTTATDWKKYKSKVTSITNTNYRKQQYLINPKNLKRGLAGVSGAYHLDHIVPVRFCFDNNIPADVCASHTNLQMMSWKDNGSIRNHIKGNIPSIFFQYLTSGHQQRYYYDIIREVFPNVIPQHSIGNTTATYFDKQTNHAILLISLDKSVANTKTAQFAMKEFKKYGVNYTILFEDEVARNATLVKKKLQHYSNQNSATRIHARQCTIRTISKDEKRKILNEYHTQGNDNSCIMYGAWFNDTLIAAMTFTKPNVAVGQLSKDRDIYEGVWELSRFVTNTEYRIPGIASKLLKYFERNNTWKYIYSFADMRWSNGNLYNVLNFTHVSTNPPDYFYVIDGIRKHRWNYRKDILKTTLSNYDSNLTEYQNMELHGYWRVWGCGTLKFQKQNVDIN